MTIVSAALAAFSSAALGGGEQFSHETASRFPSPAPTEYSNQLTIGDIDGDGDLDIIFANGGNFNSPGAPQIQRVYVNDGNGFFTDESAERLNASGLCRGAELGDVDNDGDLDLILVQDFNRRPQLYINDGDGFFTYEPARLPGITLSSSRAQFGDIDNDGDLDIYITTGANNRFSCGQYRIYVNDGDGFFTDETEDRHPIGLVCNNMDCIFGDIDNDFDLDVRTGSTGSNNSRLYVNDGTGVYTQASIPPDSTCYSYDFGDIDGDGDLDMIGVNAGPGSTELLLENDSTGTYSNVSGQISPNQSLDDNDSKFFDYDNDGDLDLIVGRLGSGGERLYDNDGGGTFTQVFGVVPVISDSTLDIMVADLDNDGDYDIVTAQGESGNFTNRIYINNGPADTVPPTIVDTEQAPTGIGPTGEGYVIRALILDSMTSDRNFFDKGVHLNYTVNGGKEQQVPMQYSGGQVYRGVIPPSVDGTVEYYVTALDWNENLGVGETLSFEADAVPIPGDLDGDGDVDTEDLLDLLGSWGDCDDPCPPSCDADIDEDCTVGTSDLLIQLGNWG